MMTLNGKPWLLESAFFSLREDPLLKELSVQESKQKVTKVASLVSNNDNSIKCIKSLQSRLLDVLFAAQFK